MSNDPQLVADALATGGRPSPAIRPGPRSTPSSGISPPTAPASSMSNSSDRTWGDFGDGTAQVVRRVPDPWTVPAEPLGKPTVREVEADLASFMSEATCSAPLVRSELTGGKDSRLVLAIAAKLGIAARWISCRLGPGDPPMFGSRNASALGVGLPWCRHDWPAGAGSNVEDIVRNARLSSGQLGAGHVLAFDDDGVTFSGMMGETMMTNFPSHRCESVDQTISSLRRAWAPKGGYLLPDARTTAEEAMVAEVRQLRGTAAAARRHHRRLVRGESHPALARHAAHQVAGLRLPAVFPDRDGGGLRRRPAESASGRPARDAPRPAVRWHARRHRADEEGAHAEPKCSGGLRSGARTSLTRGPRPHAPSSKHDSRQRQAKTPGKRT